MTKSAPVCTHVIGIAQTGPCSTLALRAPLFIPRFFDSQSAPRLPRLNHSNITGPDRHSNETRMDIDLDGDIVLDDRAEAQAENDVELDQFMSSIPDTPPV